MSRGVRRPQSRPRHLGLIQHLATASLCLSVSAIATAPASAAANPVLPGRGSIEEAWLTGAGAGDKIVLLRNGSAVSNPANPGTADALGSLIIRNLSSGAGYSWIDKITGGL